MFLKVAVARSVLQFNIRECSALTTLAIQYMRPLFQHELSIDMRLCRPVLVRFCLNNTPVAYESARHYETRMYRDTPGEKCRAPDQNSLYKNVFAR